MFHFCQWIPLNPTHWSFKQELTQGLGGVESMDICPGFIWVGSLSFQGVWLSQIMASVAMPDYKYLFLNHRICRFPEAHSVSRDLERFGDTLYTSQRWANCSWDEIILQMLTGERVLSRDRQNISPVASMWEGLKWASVQICKQIQYVQIHACKHTNTCTRILPLGHTPPWTFQYVWCNIKEQFPHYIANVGWWSLETWPVSDMSDHAFSCQTHKRIHAPLCPPLRSAGRRPGTLLTRKTLAHTHYWFSFR